MLDRADSTAPQTKPNWLLSVGDFDILRDAVDASAVFWHRAKTSPKRVLLTLGLVALAILFIVAAIIGPDKVGLGFLPTAAFAVSATVLSVGAALFTGWTMMKFLPTRNDRIIIGLRKTVREEIDPIEEKISALSEEALLAKTSEFRDRLEKGESLASIRPEAYACVREASKRARAHRQYECQLIGGNVIENNSVAEMRTGEGKTIVCYMANYMKALQGLKVHMVTVNDYLVKRDAEFCTPIFEMLGVSVGFITSDMPPVGPGVETRRAAYACDITYGTNSEFGFDYLRDNMKSYRREQMQGQQDFAVVDEVDSILIDEARTPLIISGPAHDDVSNYRTADNIARTLVRKQQDANREMAARIDAIEREAPKEVQQNPKFKDGIKKFRTDPFWLSSDEAEAIGHKQYFVVEMDSKRANMTEHGAKLAQQELGIGTFYDSKNMNWPHYIDNALRAHQTYVRDKEYVVQEGAVIIVDEFTGRLMHGRQWSDGLHQAVEAKEGVQIKQETQTLATITLQNLFKMYKQLAGMTGTAMTEAEEFMKIYRLDVVTIPTNKPIRRLDYNDKIYKTGENKFDAIVEEIRSYSQEGHPADPWSLHDMLKQADNELAKLESSESNVDKSAIAEQRATISNALREFNDGKGSEEALSRAYGEILPIELQGRPVLVGTASVESSEKLSQLLNRKYGIEHEVLNAKNHAREAEIVSKAGQQHEMVRGKKKSICGAVTIATNMAGRGTDIVLGPGVARLGGLHVVGTERHESRRIDNQLRGRCGRQGDPGSSRFFLSMDDPLLRLFMGEWVLKMLNMLGFEEGMAIEDKRLNRGIGNAQKKVEERNFSIRKNLLEYDEVMDHQRKTFYTTRQQVVEGRGLSEMIWEMIDESVGDAIDRYYDPLYAARCVEEWVAQHLGVHLEPEKLDTSDFENLTAEVREMAQYELRSSVQRTFGEYIDSDIAADEWDVRGFQTWAQQYGLNFTQNQVKNSDPYDLLEQVMDGASKTVDETDLTPLQQYIDPLYAKARFVRWAREKFDIDMSVDDIRQAQHDEVEVIVRDKMREVYKRREIEYPVDAIMGFAMQRGGQNRNEILTIIANWANRKFGTEYKYEDFTGKEPPAIFAELVALSEKAREPGFFNAEIDKALADHDGKELHEWARGRFGEIVEFNEPPTDASKDELREWLSDCYDQMLRYELSYIERLVLINTLDAVWKDNMYSMDLLRHSIGLRGYAEKDPKIEYKREGTRIFNEMLSNIRERVTDLIFKVQMGPGPSGAAGGGRQAGGEGGGMAYQVTQTQHADATGQAYETAADEASQKQQQATNEAGKAETIRRDEPKVGRNDPCPCGSGKKYKQCHGKAS